MEPAVKRQRTSSSTSSSSTTSTSLEVGDLDSLIKKHSSLEDRKKNGLAVIHNAVDLPGLSKAKQTAQAQSQPAPTEATPTVFGSRPEGSSNYGKSMLQLFFDFSDQCKRGLRNIVWKPNNMCDEYILVGKRWAYLGSCYGGCLHGVGPALFDKLGDDPFRLSIAMGTYDWIAPGDERFLHFQPFNETTLEKFKETGTDASELRHSLQKQTPDQHQRFNPPLPKPDQSSSSSNMSRSVSMIKQHI